MKFLRSAAHACALLVFLAASSAVEAQLLAGRVSSAEDGAMEGVLVSAKKSGANITITVVSDHDGRFAFPAAKVGAGRYALAVRATGYALDGPATVEVVAQKNTPLEIRLHKLQEFSAQLTNTEWFMSMPGSTDQKRPLIECMSCHTFERIVRSKFNAQEFFGVLNRMSQFANNTTMARVQPRVAERKPNEELARKLADYLATVNLSKGATWNYELKTLPRPQGRATRVVITEYDMPRKSIAPHDVRTDAQGYVWYSNFVENFLGRLDPKTGAHVEFAFPVSKPGFPTGSLALEVDRDGNYWLAAMFQTGLVKFNTKTRKFQSFPLPATMNADTAQQSMVMPGSAHLDGKVWTNEVSKQSVMRLDLASGKYELIDPFRDMPKGVNHSPYGMIADAQNNLYFMDFGDENIGRVDAKTLQSTIYPTPTRRSRPRRTMMDAQDRVWFAEFAANKVGMFDPKKEAIREWDVPTAHTYPYDVFVDKNGELWSGSMSSDRILRMDTETGRAIEYLLPRQTNVRRVFVDNSTSPVTFWVGSNHGASIIKLEPLD